MHHWIIMNNNKIIIIPSFSIISDSYITGIYLLGLTKTRYNTTRNQDPQTRCICYGMMPVSLLLVIAASQRGGGRPEQQMPSSGPGLPQDRLLLSWAAWSGERQTGDSISLAANKKYTWVLVVLQHIPPSIRPHFIPDMLQDKKTWAERGKKIDLSKMFNQYECFLPISLNVYVSTF